MSNRLNADKQLDPLLLEKITVWLSDYVTFDSTAYNANGELLVSSIEVGLLFLIRQGVFESVKEIKREFIKEQKAILPDFLFEFEKEENYDTRKSD